MPKLQKYYGVRQKCNHIFSKIKPFEDPNSKLVPGTSLV